MKETFTDSQLDDAKNELVTEFSKHRESLWQIVYFCLDHRLSGRVDPDDVLQQAWLDANNRLHQYLSDGGSWKMLVWIRVILKQTLINVHRRHFSSKKRDASKEVANQSNGQDATLIMMSETCIGRTSSPSQVAMRNESRIELELALNRLRPDDRTVLEMRHFQELTNKEVASRLGLSEKAASIRYVRALERLKQRMESDSLALVNPSSD